MMRFVCGRSTCSIGWPRFSCRAVASRAGRSTPLLSHRCILVCVLPRRDVEVTLGDLEEERLLRSESTGSADIARWYWSQIAPSVPPLLWISVRRGGLTAVGVAIGACIVQAAVELTCKAAISSLFAPDAHLPGFLTLIVGLPSLIFVSYLAARIRDGAAIAMAGLIVIAVLVQLMMKTGGDLLFWNQIVALVVGPSAAFTGGVISLRTRA
jgi:hypothetical protein